MKPRKSSLYSLLHRLRVAVTDPRDRFLDDVSGVVHVGANTGQERGLYARFGLRVLWIEPVPEVFSKLIGNIEGYPDQRAVQVLVTDQDDAEYSFNVANNFGASSSILELKGHREIWPEVEFTRQIVLRSTTLETLLVRERIDPADYDALIMDTQGSELLVLQGALGILQKFRFIKTEVADFEAYANCCQVADIHRLMTRYGFREYHRFKFAERTGLGSYYEITYRRDSGS